MQGVQLLSNDTPLTPKKSAMPQYTYACRYTWILLSMGVAYRDNVLLASEDAGHHPD